MFRSPLHAKGMISTASQAIERSELVREIANKLEPQVDLHSTYKNLGAMRVLPYGYGREKSEAAAEGYLDLDREASGVEGAGTWRSCKLKRRGRNATEELF